MFFPKSSTQKTLKSHLFLNIWLLLLPGSALAGLGNIISQSNTGTIQVSGLTTTIDKTSSAGYGFFDWGFLELDSLSLTANETLAIQQTWPDSTLVIRVINSLPTLLAGNIESNGRVIIISESGLRLTPSSFVRTAAFMASTLDFRNEDLADYPVNPIQSYPANGDARLESLGIINTSGGSYPDGIGGEIPVEGHIFLLGQRVTVAGILAPSRDGDTIVVAGNRVQTEIWFSPQLYTAVLSPATPAQREDGALIHVTALMGRPAERIPHAFLLAQATEILAASLQEQGLAVIQFEGAIHGNDHILLDGGGYGDTRVAGESGLLLGGSDTAGTIDVLGGRVHLSSGLVSTLGTAGPNLIRIGGDENDLGVDRHASNGAGTRLAYATQVGRDVDFDLLASDNLHVTGYSVLQEGELPILLVVGHDGPLQLPWLLNRADVYDSNGDGTPDTCQDGGDISFNLDDATRVTAVGVVDHMETTTGRRPAILDFRVHRTHVDVNRRPGRATGNCITNEDDDNQLYGFGPNPENTLAYAAFHELLGVAEQTLADLGGGSGPGIMIDFHGHQDGGDSGPLHIGYRIKGRNDEVDDPGLWDVLAEATQVDPATLTETHFDDAAFIEALNTGNGVTLDVAEMVEDSSARNLIEDQAAPPDLWALWDVLFGGDSLFKQLRGSQDGLGNPYRLYIVEDIGFTFSLRRGGFIQRRHGSSPSSKDARENPLDTSSSLHAGFVASVDGLQLEIPRQYRFLVGGGGNAPLIPKFQEDLAAAILQFADTYYDANILP